MWESPEDLWRRLKLGREEFLQRLMTTLIVGGEAPPWNTPRQPSEQGRRFLHLLDELAHGVGSGSHEDGRADAFVDEYLLPRLEASAQNGWPDWAVLWADRVWVIELKTEAASHRDNQLPYYLRLAAAAHPHCRVDLTYITGPLTKSAPQVSQGQRYSHLTWSQVLPLVEAVWGSDRRPRVIAYVETVRTIIENLAIMRPAAQRAALVGEPPQRSTTETTAEPVGAQSEASISEEPEVPRRMDASHDLLSLARATAADGRQRGVGATSPTELERLRDAARTLIAGLPADDETRFALPWLWRAGRTDGPGLTLEGQEFGYELRFSRYKTLQIKP